MVKPAEVIYDPSLSSVDRRSHPKASASQWRSFMSGNIADMYQRATSTKSGNQSDSENEDMDTRKILKDIEFLGASNMSWKERKKLENQRVVTLGGKLPKKHRTPLSVAKPAMKNQKKREQKKVDEALILGRFSGIASSAIDRKQKRKQEDRILKATEGNFRKGVLDVKNLLAPAPSKASGSSPVKMGSGKRKRRGNNKGKKKRTRKGR